MRQLNVRLEERLIEQLRAAAIERGLTMGEAVAEAVAAWLNPS